MQPQPMETDSRYPFAHHTMAERLPSLIDTIKQRNTLTLYQSDQLDALQQQMRDNAPLPQMQRVAPDSDWWDGLAEGRWQESVWYVAEMCFFREVINRVQYWQTGADPYHAAKHDELYSDSLRLQVERAVALGGADDERLRGLLYLALWGNRADLSLPEVMEYGQDAADDDLLIDDSEAIVRCVLDGTGAVHLITDNFGTELAMDLMLIGHLLALGVPVVMHVKMNPTYVSDATAADVRWMLATLPEIVPDAAAVCDGLTDALASGQLQMKPHFYWHTPHWYDALPLTIRIAFSQARVILSKGDANYRRAVYDTIWPVEQSFAELVAVVGAPFAALRTLKSDPIVGLSAGQAAGLVAVDAHWRTNGKRGIIQFAQRYVKL